ncbi:non-structural maintenance of chromosomes element 1 homolog isoform X2 [Hyposmocoma kahamanoa]|uniref:non-structural maintenance of chromosomes element 1 homolog isoform X2 n=1 Tax=Hyposmocoma kahamanoa TaxID=1477025 RepID=UPI000E6D80FF|nr:non-structural maintenance of chromosomes element 1 homolog isoform X2 [Hyposmocoma kahamanoa]
MLNTFPENDQVVPVQDLVKEINDQIRTFQQTIKIANDEVTNEEVVIFLSLGYDDATKAQGVFSAAELEFFRLLIEQIMTTDSRQVTGIRAINIVGNMRGSFSKTDAQKLLDTWCRMRYLDKDENNYALGVRAIHEFEGYLRQNMPDTIEECCLCKQIVFRGYNCPSCGMAVHTRCLNRYLEKVEKWPCCKANFSQEQLRLLSSETPDNPGTSNSTTSAGADPHGNKKLSPEKFTQSQALSATQHLPPIDTEIEPTIALEGAEDTEMTEVIPEVSQRVTRKRKREH